MSLPINWTDKVNSPQLLAFLQQFGPESYLTAEEINQIKTALNQLYNLVGVGSGITNDTGFSFVDTDFVINALFGWKFNGQDFVLDNNLSINVPYTAIDKHRTDVIVARDGNIIKLTGLEYDLGVPAPAPTYNQITDLFITQFEVNESGYGDPDSSITGDNFLKKSFAQPSAFNGVGTNQVIPLHPSGFSEIRLLENTLVSVSGFDLSLISGNPLAEVPYTGKVYIIVNLTGNPVTLKHNDGTADILFLAKSGADLVIPNNERIALVYGGGMEEAFRSWSEGGNIKDYTFMPYNGSFVNSNSTWQIGNALYSTYAGQVRNTSGTGTYPPLDNLSSNRIIRRSGKVLEIELSISYPNTTSNVEFDFYVGKYTKNNLDVSASNQVHLGFLKINLTPSSVSQTLVFSVPILNDSVTKGDRLFFATKNYTGINVPMYNVEINVSILE